MLKLMKRDCFPVLFAGVAFLAYAYFIGLAFLF
jgi:hypothetical protein